MIDEYITALALADSSQDRVLLSHAYTGSATDVDYLRAYFVSEITSYYGVDATIFDSGSITATTLVRDFIHKLVYFHDELQGYSSLVSAGQALPLNLDIAPLLRHTSWALCGEISWQTFHVYRALGYECRLIDTLNGAIDNFNDSHVFIEVRDPVTGRYFIQDPTYNAAHVALDGVLLGAQALRELVLDHPGEQLSHTIGGTVYTYYHATGVATAGLEALVDNFITVGALVTPWRIVSRDGTNALWADFRDDRRSAVADDVELKGLVADAKQSGLGFDATVQQLTAYYDIYGIEFVNTSTANGLVLVARSSGGGDLSIDFDTLTVVAGGVDKHWDALAHGEAAGLPDIRYGDAFRMVGANGIEAYFGIEATLPQQPLQGPLDSSYADGYGLFQVAMESVSIVKSTAYDFAGREDWTSWTEYRKLDDGSLLKVDTVNDDATSYRAQFDFEKSQSWALREDVFDSSGQLQISRVVNDDATSYRARYDPEETETWALREDVFSSSGQLQISRVVNDDATSYRARYDPEETETWALREDVFSSSGQLQISRVVNDDATSYRARYDPEEAETWALREDVFSSSGQLQISRVVNDDATSYRARYDPEEAESWTLREDVFNSSGQLQISRVVNDDATSYRARYDPEETETWALREDVFSSSGQLQISRVVNDDATSYRARYDPEETETWALREDVFSSSGQLQISRVVNDDATSYLAQYDPQNSRSWALRETLTDAQGRTVTELLTADDGTRELHLYDVPENNPWSSIDRYFAADGQLAMEIIVQDDGFRVERVWDLNDTENWMQVDSVFDATGTLIGHTYLPDSVI